MEKDKIEENLPTFVDRIVQFADNTSYQLVRPLTDYRACHDGEPAESRVLFTCKQLHDGSEKDEEYVIKIKVQIPSKDEVQKPVAGPSTTSAAELKALEVLRTAQSPYAPHLVNWKQSVQGDDGPLPGGYVVYTVMTKMPGSTLFDLKYWNLSNEERDNIIQGFLQALRSIHSLGIEPIDRGLRNILWRSEDKKCTIIDFELWRAITSTVEDEKQELQRWGLVRSPPSISWWAAWNAQGR